MRQGQNEEEKQKSNFKAKSRMLISRQRRKGSIDSDVCEEEKKIINLKSKQWKTNSR